MLKKENEIMVYIKNQGMRFDSVVRHLGPQLKGSVEEKKILDELRISSEKYYQRRKASKNVTKRDKGKEVSQISAFVPIL